MLGALWMLLLWPLVLLVNDQRTGGPWPEIQALTVRVRVDLSADRIAIDVPLKKRDGAVVYNLSCRGGSEGYLDSLPGNWVGPLMCTLAAGPEPSESSLLSEDESPAWFSRGQFRPEDLVGDCGRYPEFGVRRSFRLRGFRLNLDAEEVRAGPDGVVQSFDLVVSAVRDATANTPRADRPGFLNPHRKGGSCREVVRGREPLMCRDWDNGGSWGVCKDQPPD